MPGPKAEWPLLENIDGNNLELHWSIYLSPLISRQRLGILLTSLRC